MDTSSVYSFEGDYSFASTSASVEAVCTARLASFEDDEWFTFLASPREDRERELAPDLRQFGACRSVKQSTVEQGPYGYEIAPFVSISLGSASGFSVGGWRLTLF